MPELIVKNESNNFAYARDGKDDADIGINCPMSKPKEIADVRLRKQRHRSSFKAIENRYYQNKPSFIVHLSIDILQIGLYLVAVHQSVDQQTDESRNRIVS